MLYLLDTANVEEIEEHTENYPVAGVTTNPGILARGRGMPFAPWQKKYGV